MTLHSHDMISHYRIVIQCFAGFLVYYYRPASFVMIYAH